MPGSIAFRPWASRVSPSDRAAGASPLFPPAHATPASARDALLHLIRRDPHDWGEDRSRWTLAGVQRVCPWLQHLTPQGVWHLFKRLHIHYQCGREYVHSPDPAYVAKLQEIHVQVRAPAVSVVLFEDELTYYRQPTLAQAYELAGHRQPLARRSYAANTHRRVV